MVGRLAAALAVALLWILAPPAAYGHAALVEASPPDGAALAAAPATLRLVFDEPVTLVFLRLLDAEGRERLTADAATAAGAAVEAALPPLPVGSYVVSYRIVSADGHPVGGSLRFRIGDAAATATAAAPPAQDAGWEAVAAATRFAQYAALLAASGGGFFLALVIWDRRQLRPMVRRYTLAAAALAVVASALTLGAEGGLLALPALPAGLLDVATWKAGAASPQGPSVALTLLGLALLAGSLRRAGADPPRALVLAGAVLALAGLAATGHAATAPPRWLGAPMVLLHAVAAASWIGGLWPLLRVLHAAPAESAALVRRFSAMAVGAVALLIAAGACLALLQVRSLPALIETAYGRILLAKIGAVLALLACAAVNKWRLTPALSGTRGAAAALGLKRSIALELALAAAVIAATVALGTVPPPRALALGHEAAASGYAAVLTSPMGIDARIRIRPARIGRNTVEVDFFRAGAPLDPAEATLELSLPAAGIEPHRQSLARTGPGTFRTDDAELAPAGRWHVQLDALIGDFERAVFEGDVAVDPPSPPP